MLESTKDRAARAMGYRAGDFLGSGVSATVYALTDGANVLKYVPSEDDAAPYRRVMRLQRRGFCRAFATVRAEWQDEDGGWWFVQERVTTASRAHRERTWSDIEAFVLWKATTQPDRLDEVTRAIAESVRQVGWRQLTDLHTHNVGFRADESVAVIDLGSGYTAEPSPLPGPVPFERVRRVLASYLRVAA